MAARLRPVWRVCEAHLGPGRTATFAPSSTRASYLLHGCPVSNRVCYLAGLRRAGIHTDGPHKTRGHNDEEVPDEPPTTDFARMDVLGAVPVPASSVDVCMSDGFQLNSGLRLVGGDGVLLLGGEAFRWRPWNREKRLLNEKGQWEIAEQALGALSLVWPRPDLLVLGLGPDMRPLSPLVRRYVSSLGMRIEVLDTRNAAAQFNLLATERGVDEVAAALIPFGWTEGCGAQ